MSRTIRAGRLPALLALAVAGGACGRGTAPPQPGAPATTLSEADLAKPLPSPLPEVAARVNGEPVLIRNVALAARQLAGGVVPEDKRPNYLRQAMYKLIVRELLFQLASARGLGPDDKAMEQAYNEARVPYKDDAAWRQFLAEQGMDETGFRTELRVQYTVKSLLDQEAARVPDFVPEPELRAFYVANPSLFESGERLKASHIMLRIPQGMPPGRQGELKTRMEAILLRARKGEDFAKLARDNSEDPGSRGKGGQLQLFGRGQMDKGFEAAAFALKPGEISDVVATPFGFHIIKLHERLPSTRLLFEQVRPQILQHLVRGQRERNLEALVTQLRSKARIETFL